MCVKRNRKYRSIIYVLIAISAIVIYGTSCPEVKAEDRQPAVFIDREGYMPGEEKTVFFLPNEGVDTRVFYVVDKATRQTVLTGDIVPCDAGLNGSGNDKRQMMKGDLSALTEEGEYYIESPRIGRSRVFRVDGKIAEKKKEDMLSVISEDEDASVEELSKSLIFLAGSLEEYGYEKPVKDEAEKVLSRLEGAAGSEDEKETSERLKERAYYLAALSEYGYAINTGAGTAGSDGDELLKRAENEFEKLKVLSERSENDRELVRLIYCDAAMLYRASGDERYKEIFEEQYESLKEHGKNTGDIAYVLGSFSYLKSEGETDPEICEDLLEELIVMARDICDKSYDNGFGLICDKKDEEKISERLYLICMIEQTVISREYTDIMSGSGRYYYGMNDAGKLLLDEMGADDASAYIYCINEIKEREREKKQ